MSEQIDDGGPAFPANLSISGGGDAWQTCYGMSLRDYFAASIIIYPSMLPAEAQGTILAEAERHGLSVHDVVAMAAYRMADAMLKARKA